MVYCTILSLNCGKPSEDGGVKQDTTALECLSSVQYDLLASRTGTGRR